MELIRKHGNTPDVLSILSKSATERHETASSRSKNEFDSHGANYTLEEVIKPEMISLVMLANTNKDLQELALKVANKGTFKVINTYGDVEKIIGPDSLNSGVATMTIRQIYGKILQNQEPQNINMYHNTNELYAIATATTTKLFSSFKEDFSKIKTEKDVKEWINFHASDVLTEANSQVIGALKNNTNTNQNIYDNIIDYIKSTPKGDKLTIAQIKQKGSYDLVKFSSKEVPSVMANIENIRNQSQTQISTNTPKIKP